MILKRALLIGGNLLIILFLMACSLFSVAMSAASTAVPLMSTKAPPLSSSGGSSAGGACANAYFPVKAGATWSYSSTGAPFGDFTYTETVTAVRSAGFTTSYQVSNGVRFSFEWKCMNGNLAALDAGAGSFSMATSQIKMTSDSVTAVGYNIPASFASGNAWSEKVTVKGTVTGGGGKTVRSQIFSQLDCNGTGSESITALAGSFNAVKASCLKIVTVSSLITSQPTPLATNQENVTYWYAQGVGFVKSVATGGTDNQTVVLTSYKIP